MSSTTPALGLDSSGHPDVEAISDYLEDLLAPEVAAALHAHFAGCAECLDTRDAIGEIRSLLGRTDTPQLPAEIGIRIDAALAAEALLSTVPTVDPAPHGRPPTAPERPPGRPRGEQGPVGRPRRARRVRQAVVGLAALAAVGLASFSILHLTGPGPSSASSAAGNAARGPVDAPARQAGPDFTDTAFTQQIQQLLQSSAGTSAGTSTPASGTRVHPQSTRVNPSAPGVSPNGAASLPVPSCVSAGIGRPGETPLTVSTGSYHGIGVYAVVYPDRADPAHSVDAYLVDSACAQGASGESSGRIALEQTVPRG
ncbi:anti-sigma factor [Streptacidiphilus sp. EB129]|uniref:anti-sigma factor n=1 Tax=Streptacidiphilus sp. EB129 TaxID=3156262 RepID=UPI003515F096